MDQRDRGQRSGAAARPSGAATDPGDAPEGGWPPVSVVMPVLNEERHLAVGLDRLGEAGRSSTLLVVAPDDPGETLLERLADARRRGTTLFALHRGDADVAGLAHEQLDVPTGALATGRRPAPELVDPSQSLDVVQHLVSVVATDVAPDRAQGRLAALRAALGRR